MLNKLVLGDASALNPPASSAQRDPGCLGAVKYYAKNAYRGVFNWIAKLFGIRNEFERATPFKKATPLMVAIQDSSLNLL